MSDRASLELGGVPRELALSSSPGQLIALLRHQSHGSELCVLARAVGAILSPSSFTSWYPFGMGPPAPVYLLFILMNANILSYYVLTRYFIHPVAQSCARGN